jgi:hypothetical protein
MIEFLKIQFKVAGIILELDEPDKFDLEEISVWLDSYMDRRMIEPPTGLVFNGRNLKEERFDPTYNTPPDDPLFRKQKYTPLSEAEATYYLREGWRCLYGKYPSNNSLAILWAHTCLENGRFKLCRNYNYGNIKRGSDPNQLYTSYEAGEYLHSGYELFYPYHPQTFFAAWDTALGGAVGHIKFLSGRRRYRKAWEALVVGNPELYCVELKNGKYFTAPLAGYMKSVKSLFNEFHRRSDELLSWKIPVSQPKPESKPEPPIAEPEPPSEPVAEPEPVVIAEPIKIDSEPVESKPVEVVDLIPIKDDKEKLNTISNFFFTIWMFIIKVISYIKK